MNTRPQACLSTLFAILIGLTIVGCSPLALPSATESTTRAQEATLSGYPGPGEITPSAPIPTPLSRIATPRPDEKVVVGEVTEVGSFMPEDNLSYTIEQQGPTLDNPQQPYLVIVHDRATSAIAQLGDEKGVALIEGKSEQYIFWNYQCTKCDGTEHFKGGLHAHDIVTGKDIYMGEGKQVKGYEDWAIYRTVPNESGFYGLIAYNVQTGDTIHISESLLYEQGRNPTSFYAINEGKIAWIETESDTLAKSIMVYDLDKREAKVIDAKVETPLDIAISSSLVIWRDQFWRGYDLIQNSAFTPPWIPPGFGLENGSGFIYISARGDALQWRYASENGDRFFLAPVTRK